MFKGTSPSLFLVLGVITVLLLHTHAYKVASDATKMDGVTLLELSPVVDDDSGLLVGAVVPHLRSLSKKAEEKLRDEIDATRRAKDQAGIRARQDLIQGAGWNATGLQDLNAVVISETEQENRDLRDANIAANAMATASIHFENARANVENSGDQKKMADAVKATAETIQRAQSAREFEIRTIESDVNNTEKMDQSVMMINKGVFDSRKIPLCDFKADLKFVAPGPGHFHGSCYAGLLAKGQSAPCDGVFCAAACVEGIPNVAGKFPPLNCPKQGVQYMEDENKLLMCPLGCSGTGAVCCRDSYLNPDYKETLQARPNMAKYLLEGNHTIFKGSAVATGDELGPEAVCRKQSICPADCLDEQAISTNRIKPGTGSDRCKPCRDCFMELATSLAKNSSSSNDSIAYNIKEVPPTPPKKVYTAQAGANGPDTQFQPNAELENEFKVPDEMGDASTTHLAMEAAKRAAAAFEENPSEDPTVIAAQAAAGVLQLSPEVTE